MKITTALLIGVAMLATPGAAQAACALAGTWHFMAMQGATPDIKSTNTNVKNAAGTGVAVVKVFPNAGQAFTNDTSRVIKCTIVMTSNGTFTNDSCKSIGVTGGAAQTPTVSGKLTAAGCNLGGTVNVQGDPTPVTIQAGHINGNSGAGIATQGAKQVLYFTLIKN